MKKNQRLFVCCITFVVLFVTIFGAVNLRASAIAYLADEFLDIGVYKDGNAEVVKDRENIHEWGGMSAVFVLLSLAKLQEDGLIDPDTPVTDYFPEDVTSALRFSYPITVKDILNHTTGLQNAMTGRVMLEGEKFTSLSDVLINNKPNQNFKSGDYVSYSDYGICLGAYLVESVSGMPYYEYVHKNILEPLGMEHTSIYFDYSDCENVASVMNAKTSVKFAYYPAYSACGSMEDMLILTEDLVSGKSKVLSDESLQSFFGGTLNYRGTDVIRISYGLAAYYEYENTCFGIRSSNYDGMTHLYLCPDTQTAVIIVDHNPEEPQGIFVSKEYFGRAKESADSFSYTIKDMAGYYMKAGATIRGKSTFLSLMDGVNFKACGDHGLALSSNPSVPYLTQISEYGFLSDAGDVGYFYKDADGNKMIQYPTLDLVPYPGALPVLRLIVVILYYLSLIYAFGALLAGVFSFISRKVKKDPKKAPSFRKYHLIACLTVLLHGIVFTVMTMTLLMGINNRIVSMSTMMFFFGTLIAFIYLVFLIRTGRREHCSKIEKIGYYATAVAGIITIGFSFLFNLLF